MTRINLLSDYPLRGAVLENGARILLRRLHKNNFIFCCRYFDTIDEILLKYRLNCSELIDVVSFLNRNGMHTDLIEFVLEDMINRKVLKINFYDVKSRIYNSKFHYHEMCKSNYEFMMDLEKMGCGAYIASILLFEDWRCDLTVYELGSTRLRIYDSSTSKTIAFIKR